MMHSRFGLLVVSIIAAQGLVACGKKNGSAASSSSSAASLAVEDRSAQVLGYWKTGGTCTLISGTANDGLYQLFNSDPNTSKNPNPYANVAQLKSTSATITSMLFLDSGCTQPVMQGQTVSVGAASTSYPMALTGPFTSDPNLVGVKFTLSGSSSSFLYSSILIDGNQLHFADSGTGADESNRMIATMSSSAAPGVNISASFPAVDFTVSDDASQISDLSLSKSYLNACHTEGSGGSLQNVTYTFKFDLQHSQFTYNRSVYSGSGCPGSAISSTNGVIPMDASTLFVKSTVYASKVNIQGSVHATMPAALTGSADTAVSLKFRIYNGIMKLDGMDPGGATSPFTEL